MISFPKSDVLAACRTFGILLTVPDGIDPVACMQAIAANESSLGANCGPRQEPAYSQGGALAHGEQQILLMQFGVTAASSHGPWQMMFGNFSPESQEAIAKNDGSADVRMYAQEFVRFFSRYVMGVRKAESLADIGEIWNLGHIGNDPAYVAKLGTNYAAAMAAQETA